MNGYRKQVPIELELIDEGRFIDAINEAIQRIAAQMKTFVDVHGDKAAKAKAVVTATVEIFCLNPSDYSFGCLARVTDKLPSAPPAVSMLLGGTTQTDEPTLFCNASGSSSTDPRQQKIFTDDGRAINTETGEVMDEAR